VQRAESIGQRERGRKRDREMGRKIDRGELENG